MKYFLFFFGIFIVAFFSFSCTQKPISVFTEESAIVPEGKIRSMKKGNEYYYPVKMNASSLLLPENELSWWEKIKQKNLNPVKTRPDKFLKVDSVKIDLAFPKNSPTGLYITWLGHSSLLIQMDGFRILFDPVFSNEVSPVPFVRSVRRFQKNPPITAAEISSVDLIFLSHDHYDHLDKKAILELSPRTKRFVTPLGVGKRLLDWGIPAEKIQELDWWEESSFQDSAGNTLEYAGTPGRHFSGRNFFDRNSTLWISWVVWTKNRKIFHSGDTSYGPHFKQIGYHYGPFDFVFMECGQYNTLWRASHMFPEESVLAHLDVRGKILIPMHWGSFSLAPHSWQDPPIRAKKAAEKEGVTILTPRVGQTLNADQPETTGNWWEN